MRKENEITIYIRKDHINIAIIKRMGEARALIPKHGFKFKEEDISHDFVKQKELHTTHSAANEYPLFQYFKDNENHYHIGNLDSLKAFLTSPPPSVLSLHFSSSEGDLKKEEEEEQPSDNREEEEEKEPALGIISQSLQTVEGVVKYSTSWFTSWFYSPSLISPLPSSDNMKEGEKEKCDGEDESKQHEVKNEESTIIEEREEEMKDFKVVQTNWYWRQQNRVLRFDLKNKTMYRYDPADLTIRAIHPFTTLKDITCYTSQSFFQLTFSKSESDLSPVYEYYTSSSSDFPLILSLLSDHSSVVPNVLP